MSTVERPRAVRPARRRERNGQRPRHLLLVDDDAERAAALGAVLTERGYAWSTASTRDATTRHQHYDLVMLGSDRSDSTGFAALADIRAVSDVPIIAIGCRDDERAAARALRLGADDYLARPLRILELLARIDAIARRRTPGPSVPAFAPAAGRIVIEGALTVDLDARSVRRGGHPVDLTWTEFAILSVMCRHRGRAVGRRQIMELVWGDATSSVSRSLDVHITHLRAKLAVADLIRTVRGYGYCLGS